MTLATGLAMGGMRPVVALYSTFLQRAFDQTVHDVCQNDQPVLIAVDRAGPRRRGRDQPPGHVHAARPAPAAEPRDRRRPGTSRSCARCCGPRSRRTTRSRCTTRATPGSGCRRSSPRSCRSGRARSLREGRDLLFVGFGPIVARAIEAADALEAEGWSVGVINARFAKPLDRQLILDAARGKRLVVTFEESVVDRRVRQWRPGARSRRRAWPIRPTATSPVRIVGIPGDRFVDHGSVGGPPPGAAAGRRRACRHRSARRSRCSALQPGVRRRASPDRSMTRRRARGDDGAP